MLAVPYRAKDIPSPRSEFSHPDVVIVLTCLSYYYCGLSHTELYTCLELLNISDQADEENGRWAAACLNSRLHFATFPLSTSTTALNVKAWDMKQFPFKLSASGWDLAKAKSQPLTGFRGTNDSKEVLPLSVKALNLQPHTNATVLITLLQEENKVLELGDG
ncbi:hypothetical protein GE09DRAFT_1213688 [Coniochaeta sp. 2T2.1]|nr:hypothetical protein GE09DRAFT_1213688 [Coniochaeta sp. 2T2.1]